MSPSKGKATAVCVLFICSLIHLSAAANILFFFGWSSKSQEITFMPLAKELVNRGHNVTVVRGTKKDLKPISDAPAGYYRTINLEDTMENYEEGLTKFEIGETPVSLGDRLQHVRNKIGFMLGMFAAGIKSNVNVVDRLVNNDTYFDLVLVNIFPTNEVGHYIAYKHNAPCILYSSYQSTTTWLDEALGSEINLATTSGSFVMNLDPKSFWSRFANVVSVQFLKVLGKVYRSSLDKHLDETFPEEKRPRIHELEEKTAAGFQFGHPLLFSGNRPVPSNLVYLGMMNCRAPNPIDEPALMKFMDSPAAKKHGVILVTFGSLLKSKMMSKAKQEALIKVFKQLPQQVVWKWEGERRSDHPDNLFVSKWLPQQDILGHKNTKLFITHGGQSALQEAWCHKIPKVVLSVFGDQAVNGNQVEKLGTGLHIPFKSFDETNLLHAVTTILNDQSFGQNSEQLGKMLNDQIQRPLDRAVWWVEYLIRHPDYKLDKPMHQLSWWQRNLIDVYAFVFLAVGIVLAFNFMVLRFVYRLLIKRLLTKPKSE